MYMLKSLGERTLLCGQPVFNRGFVDVMHLKVHCYSLQ